MNRYQGVPMLVKPNGRRYLSSVKYPEIPLSETDIYIISNFGDRLDLIANDYYQDFTLYWIINAANPDATPSDSIYVPEGVQLRIPMDISNIIQAYNMLNNIK